MAGACGTVASAEATAIIAELAPAPKDATAAAPHATAATATIRRSRPVKDAPAANIYATATTEGGSSGGTTIVIAAAGAIVAARKGPRSGIHQHGWPDAGDNRSDREHSRGISTVATPPATTSHADRGVCAGLVHRRHSDCWRGREDFVGEAQGRQSLLSTSSEVVIKTATGPKGDRVPNEASPDRRSGRF
mmetsp:Transcript_25260/g.57549  ORF Transcript_25260/g.57549 Transcript_25260/m.57549 type:complete len:191 (-) Transcript_25260:178-750(-)